ncbi:MAG: hypothetical protein ACTJLL_01315 [Anaplasma sp.]
MHDNMTGGPSGAFLRKPGTTSESPHKGNALSSPTQEPASDEEKILSDKRQKKVQKGLQAVNSVPIVSDLLKFLELPSSRGLGIPDEHRARNILANVPVPGSENSCTIKVGNAILDGSKIWGTISFTTIIAPGETQEFFIKHATRALCNFCNMYLAPVFLSHRLDCVDGEQAFFDNCGELLKVSWQLYMEGGRHVLQRGRASFVQYQKITQDKEYRFFSMPGHPIAYSLSEHQELPVHELRATAMIHEDLLLPERCIKFAQKNAHILRTMLQVEQALHTYRYLLTLSADAARLGCVQPREDLSWGKASHYRLGVACVIATERHMSESDKPHKNSKSRRAAKACISVCDGYMHNPSNYAFFVTAEGIRVSDIALHVVREDLECFRNVPAIFPYRLMVTMNFRANARLMSRLRTLGILGLSGGVLNNSDLGSAFVVLKNEDAPKYSLSVLAKYIYLASLLLWPCDKKFAAFPGAMFSVKHEPGVLQNQDRWRGILLGHIPLHKRCTDISLQVIKEDLHFVFDCVESSSVFKSTVKSFFPSAQTAALLHNSVVCAIVVAERIELGTLHNLSGTPDGTTRCEAERVYARPERTSVSQNGTSVLSQNGTTQLTLQLLEVPTQTDVHSVPHQLCATSTDSGLESCADTARDSAVWSGVGMRCDSTLASSRFSTAEVRTVMSDNERAQQTTLPQAGSSMPTNTQGTQAPPIHVPVEQELYKMFCDTYGKEQVEHDFGYDHETSDGGTVAADCPDGIPNSPCAKVSSLSDTVAIGEAGPSRARTMPVQPDVSDDSDCGVMNPFETLERREQMSRSLLGDSDSRNKNTKIVKLLNRTTGASGTKAAQQKKGAGVLSPARNRGLSHASYKHRERFASISFGIWIASTLAVAVATALYLGMFRNLCEAAYLAQCDMGVGVGLSCTVVFFGLLAAAAQCYSSQSPQDKCNLPASSVSVVPAIAEERALHMD